MLGICPCVRGIGAMVTDNSEETLVFVAMRSACTAVGNITEWL